MFYVSACRNSKDEEKGNAYNAVMSRQAAMTSHMQNLEDKSKYQMTAVSFCCHSTHFSKLAQLFFWDFKYNCILGLNVAH